MFNFHHKLSTSSQSSSLGGYTHHRGSSRHGINCIDSEKMFMAMEKGNKIYKLLLNKKFDTSYRLLSFCRETYQLVISKDASCLTRGRQTLDIQHIREAHTLDYKMNSMHIEDKWKRDKELNRLESDMILVISYGQGFVLHNWIFLFESKDACKLWSQGVNMLIQDSKHVCHYVKFERWLKKQFTSLCTPEGFGITIRQMKPFVHSALQYKLTAEDLQELPDGEMGFESFALAVTKLLNLDQIFDLHFSKKLHHVSRRIGLETLYRFWKNEQEESFAEKREHVADFLRAYLRDVNLSRDVMDPYLTCFEFVDYLFSAENSIFDPINLSIVHDMTKPLANYWVASSHNTYLTGDQLKSESSLDAYGRALMMGCRCIELDCWDGPKKNGGEVSEIVIYHGYTMTSKLNLRDVLYTIRHYAFVTSDYPVILSIEDNCSVPAQRLMAQEIKEALGDLLLIAPVSKDETCLPSPEALKKKIILKHKKIRIESDSKNFASFDEEDLDILAMECEKRGVLYFKDPVENEWSKHVFVLFDDRLCYIDAPVDSEILSMNKDRDSISQSGEDETQENMRDFEIKPEEMHFIEEWFHGKISAAMAKYRLEQSDKADGTFLVRDSETFIGAYTLSFCHGNQVHHCRIVTKQYEGERQYTLTDKVIKATLYELITYYMQHQLDAYKFQVLLTTPCPQPQPHLKQPWFCANLPKQRAEELLSAVHEDGAFLIRYSSSDPSVFVLSLRFDNEFWHYRLKRDGRIFVVNQTVFENLNQLVEYFSCHDFVRGVWLKFPVNEDNVGQYVSTAQVSSQGCYMDIRDFEKEFDAVAIVPYIGTTPDSLTFPANAVIKVIRKEPDVWKGRYKNDVGWFPSHVVKEVSRSTPESNYKAIDLLNSIVERKETDRPNAFSVASVNHWDTSEYVLAAETFDEMQEWIQHITDVVRSTTTRVQQLRSKEKTLRIAAELSNLVVYCQAVPFNPNFVRENHFYEMCSFSESKHEKLIEKGLQQFNVRHLSRVYPQASRLTSTNFSPIPMWNTGCHMVALNYQTGDRAMQLSQGRFSANGRCGYVLKPQYLMDETFKLDNKDSVKGNCPLIMTIHVIAGRQLCRRDKSKGICSPCVTVEVIGLPFDCHLQRTNSIASNGLNPYFNEIFMFRIHCPEVAMLRFNVDDADFMGAKNDPFIGQAVFPVDCLRGGFRSVPLLNQFSEPLELSALLVHIDIKVSDIKVVSGAHKYLQNGRTIVECSSAPQLVSANSLTASRSSRSMSVASSPGVVVPASSSPVPTSPRHLPHQSSSIDLSSPPATPSSVSRLSTNYRTGSTDSETSLVPRKSSSAAIKRIFRMGR